MRPKRVSIFKSEYRAGAARLWPVGRLQHPRDHVLPASLPRAMKCLQLARNAWPVTAQCHQLVAWRHAGQRCRGTAIAVNRRPVCSRGICPAESTDRPHPLGPAQPRQTENTGAICRHVLLFEEAGKFMAGRVLSEADASAQVELDSGKRVKVKAANMLIRFEKPAPAAFVAAAQSAGRRH